MSITIILLSVTVVFLLIAIWADIKSTVVVKNSGINEVEHEKFKSMKRASYMSLMIALVFLALFLIFILLPLLSTLRDF